VFELAASRCFEVPVLRGTAELTPTKAIGPANQESGAVFRTGTQPSSVIVTHGLTLRTA
jgi:hypothetical protein